MAASLAKNNVRRDLNILDDGLSPEERLPAGHMRLYNFYRPGLQAELYSISTTQHIVGPPTLAGKEQIKDIFNIDQDGKSILTQQFAVVAPQFNLDPKIINSYYPPDGHEDEGRILPHIVFNDPHAPWYRPAGISEWMNDTIDTGAAPPTPRTDGDDERGNLTPWLALMVFKADELRVPASDATALGLDQIKGGKVAPSGGDSTTTQPAQTNVYDEQKQPASGAFPMTVGDYLTLTSITSRVYYEAGYQSNPGDFTQLQSSTDTTSVIFPLKSTVKSVFGANSDLQGLRAQKLHSHVRQLNTIGFPDAGVQGNGYYSVVVSMMTGDLTTTAPSNHVVHLVSIEHLDSTITDPKSPMQLTNNSDRIGLVSLFTWTYHCIPEAINFELMMTNLGKQAQPLRPPLEQLVALQQKATTTATSEKAVITAASKLYDRMQAGYTIARWRAPSGEESMAFNRGPLVPTVVPDVPTAEITNTETAWPVLSMHGRDFGVVDETIGVLDATYAAAWSLGRLVAVSDSVFNAALMRFRSAVWSASTSALRKDANHVDDWSEILTKSVHAIANASRLASGGFEGAPSRINKPADVPLAPPVDHPDMAGPLADYISTSVTSSATTADGALYDGFQKKSAASSDWEVVYNWVYDCLFLGHLPAHVLFPEPSHLKSNNPLPVPTGQSKFQQEALRFFYIDHAWLDCFIDGALSCANHVEPQYDNIRLKVKQIINKVLDTPVGTLKKKPPVPRYGFVIRSAAVKATPDLKLTVRCWTRVPMQGAGNANKFEWVADPNRDPLVRHTKLDDYTILSLLDCLPEEVAYIEMAQPAHQQRFAFGVNVVQDDQTQLITTIKPEIDTIKLFTNAAKAPPHDETGQGPDPAALEPPDMEWKALLGTPLEDPTYYDSGSRCINSLAITQAICDKLVAWGSQNGCFDESEPPRYLANGNSSSSMLGLELNDRAYHFKINGVQPSAEKVSFPDWTRKLWAGPDTDKSALKRPLLREKKPAAFTTVTPSMPTGELPVVQPAAPLNQIPTISVPASPITPLVPTKGTRALGNAWASSKNAQFELLVHPDYRPPPLRPSAPPPTGDPTKQIFSPLDYLATETKYLFDVIFSLRRRNKGDTRRTLRALRIEIPISRAPSASDAEKLNQFGNTPREPLLRSGETAHAGASILYNQRFVPSLYNGPASRIGDVRWDDLPVLGITLLPRSSQQTGIYLGDDDTAAAITVGVGDCQLNPVVIEENTLAYVAPGPQGWSTGKVDGATKVRVRLVEEYSGGFTDEWSFCTVVKVKGKDKRYPDK